MRPIAAKTLKMIQYIQDHPDTPVKKLMARFKVGQATVYKVRRTALERARQFESESQTDWTVTTTEEGNLVASLEPTKVDAILDQRATQYGKFIEGAEVMQTLKQVVRTSIQKRGTALAFDQLESIDMIIHKLGRIINGNPDNVDSWRDIAGYATLVADRLEGNVR